jgi:SNF2 family DNA or RNA helicase
VRRFAPDIVVLDEAQRIKNWATKSAAYVKSLDAPYRLVLTGTPMENRFDDSWTSSTTACSSRSGASRPST